MNELISYGARVSQLASDDPDAIAFVFAYQNGDERIVSRSELDRQSNRVARMLDERGAGQESTVVIGLPNSPEHFFCCYGVWKVGSCVLPMRHDTPQWERDRLLEIAGAAVIIADWPDVPGSVTLDGVEAYGDARLDEVRTPFPAVAIGTGGSTGRPKIIRTPAPGAAIPRQATAPMRLFGWEPGHTHIICGPLYHMNPFWFSHLGLFDEQKLVVMERFNAERAIDLIEKHRVNIGTLVPTMVYRIVRVPGVEKRDFSSIVSTYTGGATFPDWVKRKWIEILGPERVWEGYGSTEQHGNTFIRGDEWLEHPGSVGRPSGDTVVRICDDDFNELPPGKIGEVFMKHADAPGPTFEYVCAPSPRTTHDGLVSVGDLGWRDEDGHLHIADRRVDMIVSGGANIYPAEVEAALSEHPAAFDIAVVGIPDDQWGRRVHAIIELRLGAERPSDEELKEHCLTRLAAYKAPKSFEFVDALPRDDIGKIRRSDLAAEREVKT